ncbi:hypothetical protein M9Y82_07910 [Leptospira weilii]|uniref:Putative lipoprotein n=2 Tax=Leptospira weilii TaxID=28184 RepID=N1U0B2_9LEPT|nr:hypothetical protein [Leptospira weilii]EMN90301.1 putative lipoprotein [Leptospira weilii str. UI 13098]EMY12427.1 putative lipoprotein [Leptospira weilii str. Ecochallenge]MCL8266575.1 hypothetical protein [Leptospira weilii]OMI18107.1 hypothetical protein BUQ74_06175 [Leptospira weilii serovar Heyan]
MKFSLSILLSASILFQAIVFSSGLFGCILAEKAKICECNHRSKIQKHSNAEDKNFSKKVLSENRTVVSKKLPNCHSAKSGEIHVCSCKKTENKLSQLSAFYSILFSQKQETGIEHNPNLIQIIILEYSNSGILSFLSPFKPPRFS